MIRLVWSGQDKNAIPDTSVIALAAWIAFAKPARFEFANALFFQAIRLAVLMGEIKPEDLVLEVNGKEYTLDKDARLKDWPPEFEVAERLLEFLMRPASFYQK